MKQNDDPRNRKNEGKCGQGSSEKVNSNKEVGTGRRKHTNVKMEEGTKNRNGTEMENEKRMTLST